ncbi:hypothetical protein O6P43_013141 [Quillaja saponaria]|uniref:Uncharacterized protein n=1 Tax=Quillaja saponaria TaxID=32244 RepID=A0AAD7M349_QUISA|nr:hypothetical protein O6P43_013141 [Quillaja saponaria]
MGFTPEDMELVQELIRRNLERVRVHSLPRMPQPQPSSTQIMPFLVVTSFPLQLEPESFFSAPLTLALLPTRHGKL